MATLRSAIQIYDGMSGPLRTMHSVMSTVISSFQSLQDVSSNAIDTASIQVAQAELADLGATITMIEEDIERANRQQQQFNDTIYNAQGPADNLLNKVKKIAAAAGIGAGILKTIGLSDQLAGAEARLSLIVDDGGSVEALQQKIFASAQSARGSYMDTMHTVSKLGLMAGNAFTGNNEVIKFAELMNKNFIIAGASTQEQTSAMYQLTQAMASGRLQGDEYRSIIENAPLLAKSIEDYMRNVQGAEGSMKEWASDGLLTADVIKNALFSSADEIEERFEKIPMTWGQIMTSVKNTALMTFQPVLHKINELANSDKFQKCVDGITKGLYMLAEVALWVFTLMTDIAGGIYDNWHWLEPLFWGLVTVVGIYAGVVAAYNIQQAISNGLVSLAAFQMQVHAAKTALATGATFAQTAAQYGLNAALLACPVTWIILAIILIIALIYAAVAAVNHFAGTSYSATGIICGAFMVLLAVVGNILVALWNLAVDIFVAIYNAAADVCNLLVGVFTLNLDTIARAFFGLADTVLGVLEAIARAIDTVFGSNLGDSVRGWRDNLSGWVDRTFDKGEEIFKKINADDIKLGRFEYGAAYDLGYEFGSGIDKKLDSVFNGNDLGMGSQMEDIIGGVQGIDSNTGAMKDAMTKTEEDLKYLRDLAEQEVINRFTTAEVKVEMVNHNNINSSLDLDGIIGDFTDGVEEAMYVMAEGVH